MRRIKDNSHEIHDYDEHGELAVEGCFSKRSSKTRRPLHVKQERYKDDFDNTPSILMIKHWK
jgi:hypothetical protein